MKLPVLAALAAGFIVSGAAQAEPSKESKKCLSAVETVTKMRENSDSGEKELGEVDVLVEVAETLCDGEFIGEAEKLLGVSRGIMGTEEGAEAQDDSKK